MEKCPRCGKMNMREVPAHNSVSRRDNSTYICPPCGDDEAFYDYALAKVKGQMSKLQIEQIRFEEKAWLTLGQPFNEIFGKPYIPLMARNA